MFQHTSQRAFLNRWKIGPYLYRIGKDSRVVKPFQSAARLEGFGAENWQSLEMEKAFAEVEKVVGYTDYKGEIQDPRKVALLAKWLALHLVRNRRHRDFALANHRDYQPAVELQADTLSRYFAFFADFAEPVFITADNPIAIMASREPWKPEWIVAPLSPRRCIYSVSQDCMPSEGGNFGLRPSTVNQLIFNEASEFCLSFDRELHLP